MIADFRALVNVCVCIHVKMFRKLVTKEESRHKTSRMG